jgi:hypothetical protein
MKPSRSQDIETARIADVDPHPIHSSGGFKVVPGPNEARQHTRSTNNFLGANTMNSIRLLACIGALAASSAFAQSSPTEKGTGHEPGGLWGQKYTPGWSMMSGKERQEHKEKIEAIKTRDACRAFIDQVQQQMDDRAKGKGSAAKAKPPRDACAKLKN